MMRRNINWVSALLLDIPDADPDDFLSPSGLRSFNRPGFFASIIGMSVSHEEEEEEDLFDPSARFVDGLIASLIATLLVFPLDVVKTRQQMTRPWEPVCAGISQCFKRIYRNEGIRGLFRGATIVVVMTTPEKALKQVSNEYFRYLMATRGDKHTEITFRNEIFAGFVTGLLPMLVNSPADMIKSQLQDAGRLEKPKMSSWGILRYTLKTCGIYGLYAGGVSTMMREVIFSAGYFPLMEHIRKSGIFGASTEEDRSVLSKTFVSGLVAASIMAWITTPLEVAQTRIQISSPPLLHASSEDMATDAKNKVEGKGKLDGQTGWTENPFRGVIIHQTPIDKTRLTMLIRPSADKVATYRRALRRDPMPFHIPPEKPIRKYTPIQSNVRTTKLAKSEEMDQKTTIKTPVRPSRIYYDVSQQKPTSYFFVSAPSVGRKRSEVYNFRSRPSVGFVRKKYGEIYRTKILEESGTGWGHKDFIQYQRVLPPPPRKKFYTFRIMYRIFNAQGIKALFRGAGCRVAAIAPRMAITQMLYSLHITDRFL